MLQPKTSNRQRDGSSSIKINFIFFAVVAVLLLMVVLNLWVDKEQAGDTEELARFEHGIPDSAKVGENTSVVIKKIEHPPTIDYADLDRQNGLTRLMEERKQRHGLKESLDLIIKSDESFRVGKTTVHMGDILERSLLKRKKIFEQRIEPSGKIIPEVTDEYGIHVAQEGDNLWKIHFRIIQEYYKTRGVTLSSKADQPNEEGYSSGFGKLLKFSEAIVIVYNIHEQNVVNDIDLIEPLSKIVVYNMNEIFSLLEEIDYDNVDKIQFDGETIWISTQPKWPEQ